MNRLEAWKGFGLGTELSVSGTFIYYGLRRFHEIPRLEYADDLFEALYNLAVGIERLLKIAVVFVEPPEGDVDALEESLITHSHTDLMRRVRARADLTLGAPHNDLLTLLTRFYRSHRYGRFSVRTPAAATPEVDEFVAFLHKHLGGEVPDKDSLLGVQNNDRYRRFVRRTAIKISRNLFEVIQERARTLNLYPDELRHGSKAYAVFYGQVDSAHEDVLWKELLIFFLNTHAYSNHLAFIRSIPPLEFDPELVDQYLDCFRNNEAKSIVMDELKVLYEDLGDVKGRLDALAVVGSGGIRFTHDFDGQPLRDEEE